jgi:hypothetical protein
LTRDWSGYNIAEYDLQPALFNASDDTLEQWEAFWHQINGGAAAGYIVDPISATHRDLICGPITDGTMTTYPLPLVYPAVSTSKSFKDGAPTVPGTASMDRESNQLTDIQAACDGGVTTGLATYNAVSISAVSYTALDGLYCVEVDPSGAAPNLGVTLTASSTYMPTVTVGNDYTVQASFLSTNAAHDYRVTLDWYDSTPSHLSYTAGSDETGAAGTWVHCRTTGTAPSSAAYVRIIAIRPTSSDAIFCVDCLGVSRGDYETWHLPSQSPGLIEYNSAPSAGQRVTATATGKRVTRCRFEPGTRWSMTAAGHSMVRSIRATEWVEF